MATFGLLCFNQEAFIESAVLAALAQTYQPLQIVISDDASSDGTVAIIKRVLGNYDGPHEILFNVNESNLGIGAHINKVFEMSIGELIVFGAGDDISNPERTERFVEHWLSNGKSSDSIYCGCRQIDEGGADRGEFSTLFEKRIPSTSDMILYRSGKQLLLLGACSAYTPAVLHYFGKLRASLPVEDIPLAIRASMLGGISYLPEYLVQYRVNVSVWLPRKLKDEPFSRHLARMKHRARANSEISSQILRDSLFMSDENLSRAAARRFAATSFCHQCSADGTFSFLGFFRAAIYSRNLKGTFFPAILHGFPKLHYLAFQLKQRIQIMMAWKRDAAR